MHLDLDHAIALARFAAPALDVEREASRAVAARLRLGEPREPVADRRERARIRGRVGARRAPDRRLVDVDDLVELFEPLDALVRAGMDARAVELARRGGIERIDDQRGFARAGHAGDAGEEPYRDIGGHVLQIVLRRPDDANEAALLRLSALLRQRHLPRAGQILPGERLRVRHDLFRRALRDHLAAVDAGARADVDHVVGLQDRVLVVLDDDDGVANVAQVLERPEQPVVVALMQSD